MHTTTPSHPQVAVDCYVRASLGMAPADEIVETLYAYDEEGLVDELAVEIWPEEIGLTGDVGERAARDHYDRFQKWADDRGVSLEPAFMRRERTTLTTDDSETVLVFPLLCLAVRVDGELVTVAPHRTETTTYTVADALEDVASLSHISSPEDGPESSLGCSVIRGSS